MLLLLLWTLLLLLFARSVLRFVCCGNFFEFFSVVAVVLVDINGEFNFFFGLCRRGTDASCATYFTFEGRVMDGWD